MDQVKIQRFFEKTKKKKNTNGEDVSDVVSAEQGNLNGKGQEKLRKKVTQMIKKQKVQQVRKIVDRVDDSKPWGQEGQVKVCDVYKFCNAIRLVFLIVVDTLYWLLYRTGWMSFDSVADGNGLYTTSG